MKLSGTILVTCSKLMFRCITASFVVNVNRVALLCIFKRRWTCSVREKGSKTSDLLYSEAPVDWQRFYQVHSDYFFIFAVTLDAI